jgi:long-subunit fatty acid transport protein
MENMKNLMVGAAGLALLAGSAGAGGIDRTLNPYSVLFETGDYVEFSYSSVSPRVSGVYPAIANGGVTGDMARDYTQLAFAYKNDLSDQLSLGLFVNQPYGAMAQYDLGFYQGLEATWTSDQVAAVLKYRVDENFSVYGGLKYVQSAARIDVPDALPRASFTRALGQVTTGLNQLQQIQNPNAGQQAQITALQQQQGQLNALANAPAGTVRYQANGETDGRVGYILGVAYERPEIALRVALTYESALTHKMDTLETWAAPFGASGGTQNTITEIEIPQSIRLDFQSGIAANTLAFGSVRWAEWSKWEVAPPGYFSVTGDNVTDFENDVTTWQLGVARRFNDSLSGFARVTYEKANGGISSRLSPTDGATAFGLGLRLTQGNVTVTTGVEYVQLGDAVDGTGTVFEGNDAIGFGLTVGVRF